MVINSFQTRALILCFATSSALAQGTFYNLDFEWARLRYIPAGQYGGMVAPSNAFPGWTIVSTGMVLQNNSTIGLPSIDILGPYWSDREIIGGLYTALLVSGTYPDRQPPANLGSSTLAQVGEVPPTALSIHLKEFGSPQFTLSLGGQNIPLVQIGGGSNYTLYGGDISQFAGQTVELRLSAVATADSPFNWVYLDDIEFSPLSIPEPPSPTLVVIGVVIFWMLRRMRDTVTSRGGPRGRIYASVDSGATWSKATVPDINWSYVASSADGNKCVAAAVLDSIYTSTNQE